MAKDRYTPNPVGIGQAEPFDSVEALWFWFIQAQQARVDGARAKRGAGLYMRACEPVDVLRVLDRLHRSRALQMDHMMVLRHYGVRMLRPDSSRALEQRASALWDEAMTVMEPHFVEKGLVAPRSDCARFWGGSVVVPMHIIQESFQ